MRKKLLRWLSLALVPVLCTSCQFMPAEEVLPATPVIHSYEEKEYEQAAVMRGDLILTKEISCQYTIAKMESTSFSQGGLYIEKIYASKGQQVKAGEVLAELESETIKEQILDKEYELKVLYLKIEHLLEDQALELQEQDILLGEIDWLIRYGQPAEMEKLQLRKEKQEASRAAVVASYAEKIKSVEDSIYIQELQMQELLEKRKQRQIIASIDGTVTYVKKVTSAGQKSVKGQTFVTIADLDTGVYMIRGNDAQYFNIGDEVTITSNKQEVMARVIEAAELGLETVQEGDYPTVYLKLDQPDPTLEERALGTIEMIIDERHDVLYLDKEAINNAGDEQYVYMLNEDGLRIMQTVTTGLVCGDYVEITGGLAEGDRVILE